MSKNHLYESARQKLLSGEIDWLRDDFRVMFVTEAYRPRHAHQRLDRVPVWARATPPVPLTGKRIVDGAADADDVTFPTASTDKGDITAIVIYRHSDEGEGYCDLIAYLGESVNADGYNNFPFKPNGQPVFITWDEGKNKIFKLPTQEK